MEILCVTNKANKITKNTWLPQLNAIMVNRLY